jgi:glycosyltransferase involved in cell wall biosynthesis
MVGGFTSRFEAFIRNIRDIRTTIKNEQIDIVHFVDNFGLAMPTMKILFRKPVVCASIPTARTGNKFYDFILKTSYSNLDHIVAFTDFLKENLFRIGIDKEKISVIRWGARIEKDRTIKSPNKEKKVLLWSGFLTQVREEDFLFAIDIAKKIVAATDKCRFVFCFKPHYFQKKYRAYESKNIEIQPNLSYHRLIEKSDVFFCPIKNRNKIIAPPLTWIEMMLTGMPVITTQVNAVEEIIHNGVNGYACKDEQAMITCTLQLIEHDNLYLQMSANAARTVLEQYNLTSSSTQYQRLWERLYGQT